MKIKVDNVNGKHSAVFKNDDGENEVLISKLLGVLKWNLKTFSLYHLLYH